MGTYTRVNSESYARTDAEMEERAQILKEHQQISDLYQRLSGNISGFRMDLETFVQRQYLGTDPVCRQPAFPGNVGRTV